MKYFFAFTLLNLVFIIALQGQNSEEFNHSRYIKSIKKERKLKDIEIKSGDHSPLPDEEKASFVKLKYYHTKVKYRKVATFNRFDEAKRFLMKTTTERLPEYSLYGEIVFRHNSKNYTLNVYQNIELIKKPGYENHLFIPFNDETNGHETYGGGRFLDITETGADSIIIDFNKAYNPYCAYNHKFSCPIPPESNALKIKIKAGEKKWHEL